MSLPPIDRPPGRPQPAWPRRFDRDGFPRSGDLGPAGVGKQRLALWLAQLVFCASAGSSSRADSAGPVGWSKGWRFADLHWFVPIPRPKAADPDKAVGRGGRGHRRGDGGAARQAALRAAGRHGEPLDGLGAAAPPARVADVGRRRAPGVHPRRRRAAGPAGVESGSGERAAQAAGGAAGREPVRADDRGPAAAPADDPLAGGAGPAQPAVGRRGARVPPAGDRARRWRRGARGRGCPLAAGSIGEAFAAGEESGKAYQAAGQLLEAVLAGPGAPATSGR